VGRLLSAKGQFRSVLVALVVIPSAIGIACSLTGPDAPKRENGCIDTTCAPVTTAAPPSTTPGSSGGEGGPGISYPDPLAGTTMQGTLLRGRLRFTEGPVWIGGKLLFTDISSNTIHELMADNTSTVWRNNTGGTNGLAVDRFGNLFSCEGNNKRVTKSPGTKGAATTPITGMFNGQPLNSPNDIVVRADNNIYFTDPNYSGDPNTQDNESVYRIDPNGTLSRLSHDFGKPNGIGLSPDGLTIYVVDNGVGKLMSAAVDVPGGVAGPFVNVADVPGGDGMAVDDAGNLYVADDAGVDVFSPTGTKIGTIKVPVKASNCTFGGTDRQTLYITANGDEPTDGGRNPSTGLYSIRLNVPGLP
jgi:gluconolactonase